MHGAAVHTGPRQGDNRATAHCLWLAELALLLSFISCRSKLKVPQFVMVDHGCGQVRGLGSKRVKFLDLLEKSCCAAVWDFTVIEEKNVSD